MTDAKAEKFLIEVSAGEIVDRMTILWIKQQKAAEADEREKFDAVSGEIAALSRQYRAVDAILSAAHSKEIVSSGSAEFLPSTLENINRQLWDVEDELRRMESAGRFDQTF